MNLGSVRLQPIRATPVPPVRYLPPVCTCKVQLPFIESLLMIKLHRSIAYCVLLGCLIGLGRPGSAQLMVGAAADLGPALSELTNNYHQKGGGEVRVSLGSSGNLTQQIKNGAPFDVFLSADEDYPKQLI